ncbi:MAG: hypothetical protein QW051_05065 [Candidatus Aenigmatarchaeota archaeon]
MKRIMIIAIIFLLIFSSYSFSLPRCSQMRVYAMGGWKEVKVNPNGTINISCGECMNKICYVINEDGSYVIGTKCNVRLEYLNCPNDNNNPHQQLGLINAIFEGYLDPSDPGKGLKFRTDQQTIEIRNYDEWCKMLPYAESSLTFFIGEFEGD